MMQAFTNFISLTSFSGNSQNGVLPKGEQLPKRETQRMLGIHEGGAQCRGHAHKKAGMKFAEPMRMWILREKI